MFAIFSLVNSLSLLFAMKSLTYLGLSRGRSQVYKRKSHVDNLRGVLSWLVKNSLQRKNFKRKPVKWPISLAPPLPLCEDLGERAWREEG